jgi:hypothetical protein
MPMKYLKNHNWGQSLTTGHTFNPPWLQQDNEPSVREEPKYKGAEARKVCRHHQPVLLEARQLQEVDQQD